MNINGKKISILGAVRSGIAAAKLAKVNGAIPFVSDLSSIDKLEKQINILRNENIEFECGQHSDKVFDCDFIITSPGVPSNSIVIKKAIEKNIKIISEIEFASNFCKSKIIAITGTNGKTTTTSLMTHLLNTVSYKAVSAGNIGDALSEVLLRSNDYDFVVIEISSFQLDFIDKFKPNYSVILNITPDHLDRYENSVEKYSQSKLRIFENQNEQDYYLYNADDEYLTKFRNNKIVNELSFSTKKEIIEGVFVENEKFYFSKNENIEEICSTNSLQIKGEHNLSNTLAVIGIAKIIGIENTKIEKALNTFKAVEHRIEFVKQINGVKFYNDSKATNVDSVFYSLQSFDEPINLILGGKDKGNDYKQIKYLVEKNVKKIFAVGSSAEKILNYFKDIVDVEIVTSMNEAVINSFKQSNSGDVILLSPACASFDMFDSYEHRGKVFKEEVNKLK